MEKHCKKGKRSEFQAITSLQVNIPPQGIVSAWSSPPACRTGAEPESLAAHRLSGRKFGLLAASAGIPRKRFLTVDRQLFFARFPGKECLLGRTENFGIILGKSFDFTGVLCYPIKALVYADTTAGR